MSIEDFIEEYRLKLNNDIDALHELIKLYEVKANRAGGHPDIFDYTKTLDRLKSKLDGVILAQSQFNSLVRTLL